MAEASDYVVQDLLALGKTLVKPPKNDQNRYSEIVYNVTMRKMTHDILLTVLIRRISSVISLIKPGRGLTVLRYRALRICCNRHLAGQSYERDR